jgi:GntR family transcriptional regulator, transcriptional repressor for pyruvate dehydrogenase complex
MSNVPPSDRVDRVSRRHGADLLAPIRSVRLSDEVYERLFALISKGVLGPGQKLWPEREMAERFNVSRQCVREALNRAKLFGLVEVRAGAGAYVRSLVPGSLTEPLSELLQRETGRVLEFLQVRKVLEGWCAAEAARQGSPSDLRKLKACLVRMARVSREGGMLGKPDVDFHIGIAEATHNTVMAHIVNSLQGMFQAVLRVRFVTRNPARTELLILQHERILDAIHRRDRPGATAAMISHLTFIEDEIRRFGGTSKSLVPPSRPPLRGSVTGDGQTRRAISTAR